MAAINSTVGNKRGLEDLQPISAQQAFYRVVAQLLSTLLLDLQAEECF
jgi:hypothetical protein